MGALLPLAALAAFVLFGKRAPAAAPPAASAPEPQVNIGPAVIHQPAPAPRPRPAKPAPQASARPRPAKPSAASAAPQKPAATGPVIDVEVPVNFVKPQPAAAVKPSQNEAMQAALLAEQQLGKPQPQQVATAKPVAQPASAPKVVQVVPNPSQLPPGYDAAAASARAQPMADHVRTRKTKYDRAVLGSWQTQAGLKPDGLYGPQSAAALRYFGAQNVPAPLFKGSQTTYTPPKG